MRLEGLPAISVPFPWHFAAWETLAQQAANEQLPHALLFAGASGTGKAQFALALARLLLCAKPQGGHNCGDCHTCELSAAGSHGDFRWLQPQEKSKVIKVDQVRSAIAFSHGTAAFGRRKVIVFTPADSMNLAAYNALLKSLEEPAADTFLILVCDSLHGVPATIRSRCQLRRLQPPSRSQCLGWLNDITGDSAASEQLLMLAEGRPLEARELYLSESTEAAAAQRLALRALMAGKVSATSVWSHFGDLEPEAFLALLASEVRHVITNSGLEELQTKRGQAAFRFLDEVIRMQRVVAAGANPGRQLLTDLFLSKSHIVLGHNCQGDTISARAYGGRDV